MAYFLDLAIEARRVLKKLKKRDRVLWGRVQDAINKILVYPELGKPLRHFLRNTRRVRVGSFVLVYEIENDLVRILYFEHHDRVYKK